MARLARFEEHRFIGTREDMRVYDSDDDAQFEVLSVRAASEGLTVSNGLQTFAPDSLAQARNQGFRPV